MGKQVLKLNNLLLAATIAVMSFGISANAEDQSTGILAQMEQKLLFQTYSTEEVNSRLNRIEKRVFGQALTGSTQERIARLAQAVPVKPVQASAPAPVANSS